MLIRSETEVLFFLLFRFPVLIPEIFFLVSYLEFDPSSG